jgi:hypothetical protein
MSWELIAAWVVIVLVVLTVRRMNAGDRDRPPSADDG